MRLPLLAMAALALCAAGPDDDGAAPAGQMVISDAGGPPRTCRVTDFNLSLSRPDTSRPDAASAAGSFVAANVVTSFCFAGDAGLLDWVAGRGEKRAVRVTFDTPAAGVPAVRYELEGVSVAGYIIGHSNGFGQEATQLMVERVRINGVLVY